MRKFFLMVMTVGAMAPAGAYAQKVYKSDTQVILDLTVDAGMPANAVTDVAKYTSFTPQEDALGTNNDYNGSINKEVFQKLEVAKYDLSGDGTTGSAGGAFSWVNAFNYCRNIGTGWRLPTHRELQLMFIFKPALDDLFGTTTTTFSSDYYYSSTENDAVTSFYVHFTHGYTYSAGNKATNRSARCVREVTD